MEKDYNALDRAEPAMPASWYIDPEHYQRELDAIWMISELMNVLMAFPNLIGLVLLSGIVVRETRTYFNRPNDQPSKRR